MAKSVRAVGWTWSCRGDQAAAFSRPLRASPSGRVAVAGGAVHEAAAVADVVADLDVELEAEQMVTHGDELGHHEYVVLCMLTSLVVGSPNTVAFF